MREKDYYFNVKVKDIGKCGGDLALALWYAALKNYARRAKPDKHGFKRICPDWIEQDFQFSHVKIWRYNAKLEEIGLIVIDKVHRGRKTWTGIKVL